MITNALFHYSTRRDLSVLNDKISELQGQISSGKTDPRPSTDLVRALRLNAAQEQTRLLDRFASNLGHAGDRLEQGDIILQESETTLRRIGELALRAATATTTPDARTAIMTEVRELRAQLLGFANARDAMGQPLFGGFVINGDPFQDGPRGVTYQGDTGQMRLRVSESQTLATGLNGAEVFGAGDDSVFALIDRFIGMLETDPTQSTAKVDGQGRLTLLPELGRDAVRWSLTITGPQGQAEVAFDLAAGAVTAARDAINARQMETGVSAQIDPVTGGIFLTADGPITVARGAGDAGAQKLAVVDATGKSRSLVTADRTEQAMLRQLQAATSHMIDQRTRVGALAANAKIQNEVITGRKLVMDQTLANLGELDMAAALTQLQQHMLNRSASLQAYAKITQQNLFDYMR
jgi:flagellar hook-associated protein 3 FlgL